MQKEINNVLIYTIAKIYLIKIHDISGNCNVVTSYFENASY